MLFVDLSKANSFYRDGSGVGTLIEKLLFVDLSKANSFYRDGSGVGTLIEQLLFVDCQRPRHCIGMGRCLDGEGTLL